MECVLSGNQIKSFHRAIVCYARVGTELLVEVLPDKLVLRTLNASRSAFLAVTFKSQFFDTLQLSVPAAQCSMLLKVRLQRSIQAQMNMPRLIRNFTANFGFFIFTPSSLTPASMQRLSIKLPDRDADKVQWTLLCFNGLKKTYWISCNNGTEMQDVAISRRDFPSHLVVKPRDLNRLLANFQSSLQEITLIATESSMTPTDPMTASEAKALELRSYIDPVKENTDGALHTQLWIDPTEELQDYTHTGDAVDVTFSLKELKAFTAFCEGEADIHMFFEKAGKPILLAPRFGLDDAAHADFDATLVLATMLGTQLRSAENHEQTHDANVNLGFAQSSRRTSEGRSTPRTPVLNVNGVPVSTPGSNQRSDHTVIWSELSGSVARTSRGAHTPNIESVQMHDNGDASEEILLGRQQQQTTTPLHSATVGRIGDPSATHPTRGGGPADGDPLEFEDPVLQRAEMHKWQSREQHGLRSMVQLTGRNLSNWVSDDTEDEDCTGADDFCVQSTPPRN